MWVALNHWFHEPFGWLHHFSVSFTAASLSREWIEEKKKGKKKRELKQKALKPRRQGSLCQNVGQLWACRTQYPFPWNHKVLLLDNTNISTDVLYILQNACYLFVSIYLFIWFVVLNAYLCIPIILYASGPYVKAVLLLRLSSNIILCPQPASALVFFFLFLFCK